jgi:hypothetical protein
MNVNDICYCDPPFLAKQQQMAQPLTSGGSIIKYVQADVSIAVDMRMYRDSRGHKNNLWALDGVAVRELDLHRSRCPSSLGACHGPAKGGAHHELSWPTFKE